MIRAGIRRLFRLGIARPDITAHDVNTEIETHIALRAEQLVREGFTPAAAHAEAVRRFGSTNINTAAQHRDATLHWRERLDNAWHDIAYAARALRREPLLAAFIVITLALGIGANAAMFGVADRLLLRGPRYITDPDRVVRLYLSGTTPGRREFTTGTFGYVAYNAMRRSANAFSGVAAYMVLPGGATFGHGADARPIELGASTHDMFAMLGVAPHIGRFFNSAEDATTSPQQVAVLGYGFWRRAFGADSNIIGKTAVLNDAPYTVVGVAPEGFTGPQLGRVDVWLPMSEQSRNYTTSWWDAWNTEWLHVIGRLKPGITTEHANAEVTAVFRHAYPGQDSVTRNAQLSVRPLSHDETGNEPAEISVARWLIGVAIIVLIIACSNVVNLLLARAVRRSREVAVRIALGAGRARVIRLLVTESVMLAGLGCIASVGVAYTCGQLIRSVLLPNVEWVSSPVSPVLLAFSVILALTLGVVVGLLPALQISRPDLSDALKAGVRDGGARSRRLRGALTVAQAALSVVLLIGAGLFVASLARARAVDLGIEPRRVLVANIAWPKLPSLTSTVEREAERARRRTIYVQALDRARAISGVSHASLTIGLPFQNQFSQRLRVPGWDSLPRTKGGSPRVNAVSSDYFETVGTKVVRGRAFTAADRDGTEPVAIVSERMAATLWPQSDPIGSCIYAGAEPAPCSRIVGVARDTHRQSLRENPGMQYYVPFGQERGFGGTALLIRPSGRAETVMDAVRRAVQDLDPSVTIVSVATLQESIDPEMRPWRLGSSVFGLMGALALIVAAVGLYSVMSYLVAQRTHEIGVRVALGASGANIVRLVIRDGVGMAATGVLIGAAISVALGRYLAPLLFDTSPRDPRVFSVVALTVLAVAFLASWLPAMRAKRVNPLEALRAD